MVNSYYHSDETIILNDNDLGVEGWSRICKMFGYANPENVLQIIIHEFDVDVVEKEAK